MAMTKKEQQAITDLRHMHDRISRRATSLQRTLHQKSRYAERLEEELRKLGWNDDMLSEIHSEVWKEEFQNEP